MTSITLQVNDSHLQKLLNLLKQFGPDEVDVVEVDPAFDANRAMVCEAEAAYARGQMRTYSVAEADALTEEIIRKYEG